MRKLPTHIVKRELPRYIIEEKEYHGELKQLIIDTHGMMGGIIVAVYPLNQDIQVFCDDLNFQYESHLRQVGLL